ncbi:MAG: hypothetical protein M3Y50_07285 [Acidobacteriota bacterium]|nr:hypothetical protein [Acidobacteriota bacterium]
MAVLLARIDVGSVLYGAIAVAAFWFAIQLCWSVVGKRWYGVVGRLACALGLLAVGVLMIFLAAFGD